MAVLSSTETAGDAGSAFQQTWQTLAVEIEQARQRQSEAADRPSLLVTDPLVSADDRWLTVFEREINDVRVVARSVDAGARLSADELRAATNTGRKLLDILQRGREIAAERSDNRAAATA